MYPPKPTSLVLIAALVGSCLLPAPGVAQGMPAAQRETAVAPEVNPPGDIPDDQVFITYKAPAGASISVPEGWAQSPTAHGVAFSNIYDTVALDTVPAPASLTVQGVKDGPAADLVAGGGAVEITKIYQMSLPAGNAVAVDYLSNSDVNPVTDRKIRLENRRIFLVHSDTEAIITLSAPAGADNVDQWKMMAESFAWTR